MNPNVVFFWLLVGPVAAFAALGIIAAFVALVGIFIEGLSDSLFAIARKWRRL